MIIMLRQNDVDLDDVAHVSFDHIDVVIDAILTHPFHLVVDVDVDLAVDLDVMVAVTVTVVVVVAVAVVVVVVVDDDGQRSVLEWDQT